LLGYALTVPNLESDGCCLFPRADTVHTQKKAYGCERVSLIVRRHSWYCNANEEFGET
jgi:hypothetical protein